MTAVATETAAVTTRKATIATDVFVLAFNACNTRKEVAVKLGTTYNNVTQREKALRKLGVHLKEMAPAKKGRQINVEALNKLIADATKANEESEQKTETTNV